MRFALAILITACLAQISSSSPIHEYEREYRRQEPEYYDGFSYQTPDVFSVDLWDLHGQTKQSNLLNISTSYGGNQSPFSCVASQHTDPNNQSQWLTFKSPTVPGTSTPVLQSDIRLFPGNMCSSAKLGSTSFDKVLLEYDGETTTVSTSDDCKRWSSEGGNVSPTGPIARCVFELTPT